MSEALAAMRLDFELGVAKVIAQADQIKKAMGAMGTEGERSGEKFDRATAKMAARVREATIAMEAGGRTSSRYFEALAKSKGQEKALEPLIAKLREVEAAQQRVGGGMAANDAAFNRTGMSARQLSAAMRGVPAQFTDIFTSIQGGQAPLTVLLQQGGQLKDMFGGIGPAVRALGGYLLGLITPLTVLIGVFATMGTALFVGSREWSNFRKEAILTGNTMAMSASQYTTARDAIASIGATRGKATDAMEEIAKNGQIVASSMTLVGQTAVLMEKVAGTKIADTVKAFASLADDPVKASERLNKQTNYLTAAIYEQIRALDEQGKKAQAAALAEQTYADAMQSRATKVQESLGWMERGWNAVAGAAKKAWDFMLNIGRADSPAEKMAKLSQQIALARAPSMVKNAETEQRLNGLLQQQAALQEIVRMEQRAATAAAERQAIQDAGVAAVDAVTKANEKALTKQEQANKALADYRRNIEAIRAANPASALLDPKVIAAAEKAIRASGVDKSANKELAYQAKLLAQLHGLSATFYQDWDTLTAAFKRGELSIAGLAAEQKKLLENQPFMKEMAKQAEEVAKSLELQAKAYQEVMEQIEAMDKARGESWNDFVRQNYAQRVALQDNNEQLELEARLIGTTDRERKTAIETLRIEQQLRKEIEAIKARGLGGGMTEKAIADATANAEEAKRQAGTRAGLEEQIGLLRRMDDVARDTFVSIFESGKSAFDRLKDTLKNGLYALLYEMTVKKWVLSIGAGVTGGAASAGTSAAGSAGGSMVGSALGSIFGAGGLSGSMMAGAGWLTGASTLGGSLTAATSLMATGTGAGIASGLGMMMGTLGPIALGIAAIMSFIKEGGGPKSDGYSGTLFSSITDTARANGSNPLGDSAKSMVDGITAQFDAIAGLFGVAGKTQFGVGYTVDPKGDAPTFLEVAASQNGQQVFSQPNWNVGREDADLQKAFADAIPQAMFAALKASDLSAPFRAYFDSIADDSSSEVKSAALQTAQDVQKLTVTMQQLGLPFAAFDSLAVTARANLIQLAGGLDATVTSLGAFSEAYFNEQERNAATMAAIAKVAEDLGLILPTTEKGFRALVLSQDLTTEAGQRAAAALLQVAGAFQSVTEATQTATRNALQELADSMKGFRDAVAAADDKVSDARGNILAGYVGAQDRLNALLEQSRQATLAFGSTLREYLASLSMGQFATENPAGQYQALQRRLMETAALAQGGNQGARDGLTAAANAFLESSQARSRTAVDLAMDRAAVRTLLEGVMATLPGVGAGAAGPTLEEQIVAAQAELAQWAEVAAQTGVSTEQATLTVADNIAQLKAAYDAATVEQTLANARLDVALAALETLGLSQAVIDALLAGQTTVATPGVEQFATALGVSTTAITALQGALGLTNTEMGDLADALNKLVSQPVLDALAAVWKMPPELAGVVANGLKVSSVDLLALQGSLKLTTADADILLSVFELSTEEQTALGKALGYDKTKTDLLVTALGYDKNETDKLMQAFGIADAAQLVIDGLGTSIGLSAEAKAAVDSLVSATTARSANVALVEQAYASIGRTGYGSGVSQIDSAGFSYWLNALQSGSVSGAGITGALQQQAFQSLMADPTSALSQYVAPYLRSMFPTASFEGMQGILNGPRVTGTGSDGGDFIPGLATGTNYLPQDMLFYGHAGEEVKPARYVDADRAAQEETNRLLGRLIDQQATANGKLENIEKHTDASNNTLNGIRNGDITVMTEAAS